MTQYMLMFSLGPVQSFIAQARKTRDLWLGSFLLSMLMEAAMEEWKDRKEDSSLIFPTRPWIEKNIPDLPNKYVAIFPSAQDASDAADRSQQRITECWQEICRDIWQRVVLKNAGFSEDADKIWRRQTDFDNFFEIFWVVVARKVNEEYKDWLKYTQRMFDARKQIRTFRPEDEPGEKSTISGEREALRSKGISRTEVREFWKGIASGESAYDINKEGKERLDAIDTVKRFAYDAQRLRDKNLKMSYPSTSSIATASFVERLFEQDSDLKGLPSWIQATKDPRIARMEENTIPYLYMRTRSDSQERRLLKRDGDCYFLETFTPARLKDDYGIQDDLEAKEIAETGNNALRDLLRAAREAGISLPRSYYAMIQMDGDRMGRLISEAANDKEHRTISEALSTYAREQVIEIVEKTYPGRLIYAGGDDVFALAPLARDYDRQTRPDGILTVLDLVNELQQQYQKIVKGAVPDEERQAKVTASTGIAIAHHFTSLSYVRRMAKEAEDRAKKFYDRNALVVTLLRRSGEQTQVGCHWRYKEVKDEKGQPIRLFSRFYDLFKHDILSFKYIYILLEEAPALVKLGIAAQQSEIRRVLLRQRNPAEKIKKLLPDDEVKDLAGYIAQLGAAIDEKNRTVDSNEELSTDLHSDKRRYGLVEAMGWLLVMAFLAREEQE